VPDLVLIKHIDNYIKISSENSQLSSKNMEKVEQIQNEIKQLKVVLSNISKTIISKQNASDLHQKMEVFNHTFAVKFPLSVNYYRKNQTNEINVTDGMESLETYSKSKLKQKDDYYFITGKDKLKMGIEGIIRYLENDIKLLLNQ
jgi:hypothetical protein